MTQEEKAKAYDEALERARKIHSKIANNELLGFPGQIEDIFPELRKEEKPLTSFQQCLNCILRGVYYAEVPDEKVNEFILNVVRTRTDELIKLAKKQEEQKHPNGCFTCDEYKKGYEAGRLNGFTAGYNKAMKEQKPVEGDNETEIQKAFREGKSAGRKEVFSHPEEYGLQKPAEWSDTNELVFKDICKHLKEEGYNGWVVLLNALRNGEFQPKQEWSKEDEENFKWFDKFFRAESVIAGGRDIPQDKYSWFKSLRPKPKVEWSEEDELQLKAAIEICERSGHTITADWLNSLRPSWKPDGQQLDCLRHMINVSTVDKIDKQFVQDLYEQLKKLM